MMGPPMPFTRSRVWNPALYQGGRTGRRYFEGWYFKLVDGAAQQALAVIPGVSYSEDGSSSHAFVQVVPGGGATHYFTYPIDSFRQSTGAGFEIRIGENVFGESGIHLQMHDGIADVSGDLRFGAWSPWPVMAFSPGIMGPFRFVPGMETYHGVLSMDHAVSGALVLNGQRIDFDGGRGYAEKDWGRSFPSSWIWAQSNHFGDVGTSVTLSVARVPWMRGAFVGTIAGLLHDGKLHRFATYTGARLRCIETGPNRAHLILGDRREELEIRLHGSEALMLKAPVLGAMEGRDAESLGGTIDVLLREVRGGRSRVLFEGLGRQSGIEVMNDRDELGSIACPGGSAGD